ncbi:MAG: SGNH/GDSL hydrolase family protein [Vicinamibacterales bacterium]
MSCASPTKPTPPPAAPVLTCPASQTIVSADNRPVVVTYAKPSLTGGTTPVTVVCTPDAGATFAVGANTVSCTATDAQARSSSCSFSVSVQPGVSLAATSILAFGDSMTEGNPGTTLTDVALTGIGCSSYETSFAYPVALNQLLGSSYPTQTIVTKNCGWGGEESVQGVVRLPTGLATGSYDVVLLLEGANDLNALANGTQSNAVNTIGNAIVSMIKTARQGGRTVFVGTLPPQRVGGKGPRPEWVEPVNDRLRTVAPQEGAVLVDLWRDAFSGTPEPYISVDGLHPTADGYRRMADVFLAAIRRRLETKTTP